MREQERKHALLGELVQQDDDGSARHPHGGHAGRQQREPEGTTDINLSVDYLVECR